MALMAGDINTVCYTILITGSRLKHDVGMESEGYSAQAPIPHSGSGYNLISRVTDSSRSLHVIMEILGFRDGDVSDELSTVIIRVKEV
jgi:hypothetical protein